MCEKYAFIACGIGAYDDAGPVSGKVPPILIELAVMPGSAAARSDLAKADGMARSSAPTSANPASETLRMKTPLDRRKEARWSARLLRFTQLDNEGFRKLGDLTHAGQTSAGSVTGARH